jgi:hypothetical protein
MLQEGTKNAAAPSVEPVLDGRVILVKESPKKIQPNSEEQNSFAGEDGNKLTNNVKKFMDIDGDEVVLVASAGSRKSLRSDAGDKNWFGSAITVGQVPSPTRSVTGLIKGIHICSSKRFSFSDFALL